MPDLVRQMLVDLLGYNFAVWTSNPGMLMKLHTIRELENITVRGTCGIKRHVYSAAQICRDISGLSSIEALPHRKERLVLYEFRVMFSGYAVNEYLGSVPCALQLKLPMISARRCCLLSGILELECAFLRWISSSHFRYNGGRNNGKSYFTWNPIQGNTAWWYKDMTTWLLINATPCR